MQSDHFRRLMLPPGVDPQPPFQQQSGFHLDPWDYDPLKLTVGIASIDRELLDYEAYVPHYASDIFQWLYHLEVRILLLALCLFTNSRICLVQDMLRTLLGRRE